MSGDPISGMTLKDDGNLVLFSSGKSNLYSTFDNPANTLVIWQVLKGHQQLRSGTSITNSKAGRFIISMSSPSLIGFVKYEKPKKPVAYLSLKPSDPVNENGKLMHVEFGIGAIKFVYKQEKKYFSQYRNITQVSGVQILRLDWDGGLRVYYWGAMKGWSSIDVWLDGYDECRYPLICGKYGVCTKRGCSCPTVSNGFEYFTPSYQNSPNRGCQFAEAVDLNSTSYTYRLVDFGSLWDFSYFDPKAATLGFTEIGACKQACEGNSTCLAAFFRYGGNASEGLSYLLPEVLTIRGSMTQGSTNSSVAFIKVLVPPAPPSPPPAPFTPQLPRPAPQVLMMLPL